MLLPRLIELPLRFTDFRDSEKKVIIAVGWTKFHPAKYIFGDFQ